MKTVFTGTWESVRSHRIPAWYEDAKFGIFIHWGVYSVPAYAPYTVELGSIPNDAGWFCNNPYAEWYYNSVNVGTGPTYEHHVKTYGKDFRYEDFIPMWKAEKWDPAQWADVIKQAGARYVVLTTKHHDGFCLFPSKYTDFNSTKMGPGRDITGELTKAVRNAGMRMGLYYSGLIDWQFANDPIYEESQNFTNACPTFEYADYSYKQMKELIDVYQPSILWNDIGWPKQNQEALPYLLAHYFNTVEDGVCNDRYSGLFHDYVTREYQYGKSGRDEKWEMCRGMGLSFGYNAEEGDDQLIPIPELIRLLASTVANNGNLLLNIGPMADGTIPEEQVRRLGIVGNWLKTNGEGIYETRCSKRPSEFYSGGMELHYTRKDKDLYIMVYGLQEGTQEIFLSDITAPITALDPSLCIQTRYTQQGAVVLVENYTPDLYTIVLKASAQE